MSEQAKDDDYAGFADWYERGPLAAYVIHRQIAGASGIHMFESKQPAGDMSDPVFDDLVLAIEQRGMKARFDYGAGAFAGYMAPLSIFIAKPGMPTSIHVHEQHAARTFVIPRNLVNATLGLTSEAHADFGRLHASACQDKLLQNLLERLWKTSDAGATHSQLFADAAAVTIIAQLATLSDQALPKSTGGLSPWMLKRVQDYQMTHLADDIALNELAAITGLSLHHFCRAFKQSTGLPPAAWQTSRRIERAQEMMTTHPEMGLMEIALSVGYGSQAAFGVAFKRVTGATPGQWRRERS